MSAFSASENNHSVTFSCILLWTYFCLAIKIIYYFLLELWLQHDFQLKDYSTIAYIIFPLLKAGALLEQL